MTRVPEPTFSIGIEEEYLLVDRGTRDLIQKVPKVVMDQCSGALKDQVSAEFLQCQIEVGTDVCSSSAKAREELSWLRRCIAEVTARHGMAPIAASSHPFARWQDQHRTEKDRYQTLATDHQAIAERLLICGMHVHVGIEDEDLRIDTMTQLSYFLPHVLALTTSSPFWEGHDTGLKSHRLTIFDGLPRTGTAPQFASYNEFRRSVDVLVHTGLIEDATKVWWDIRPSDRYPTIEVRICDVCTRLDDAIAVASIIRCLARFLYRLRSRNQRWRTYERFLIDENRWRAQRYGMDEGLIDFGAGTVTPYADLLEDILGLIAEDAVFFGCQVEVDHARAIVKNGTSADRQLSAFASAMKDGSDKNAAFKAVVDRLAAETIENCG